MNHTGDPYGANGSLRRDDGENVIRFERTLAALPEVVWESLTTPSGLESWLAETATIEPGLGGAVTIEFDAENVVTGRITAWSPPFSFDHEWVINGEHTSHVTYELDEKHGDTHLTLTHRGLPDEMCGGYTPGWHAYVVRLSARLRGQEPPEWLEVFQAVVGSYD